MAGIIGIYGLVVSVLIANDLKQELPLYTGFIQLGAGLAVGLAGLAAGLVVLCDPLVLTIFFSFHFRLSNHELVLLLALLETQVCVALHSSRDSMLG
jgi:hypothetical protein